MITITDTQGYARIRLQLRIHTDTITNHGYTRIRLQL